MKRLLPCALLLLCSGCADVHSFKLTLDGTIWFITCMETSTGVEYLQTVYNTVTLERSPTKVYDSTESTCAQLATALKGTTAAAVSHAVRRADATAAPALPLVYGLDQASLSMQILDPSTFNFTGVDLPGGGLTQYPTSMDMTPDGSAIWVTQLGLGQNNQGIPPEPPLVSIMKVAQQAFTGSFTLPNGISPNDIHFSLDGSSAYTSNDGSSAEGVSGVFTNSSVLVVNVAAQTVTQTIPTPKGAGSEALSPDGLLLYTIGSNLGIGPNNLTVIDTTTSTVATSVALPDGGFKIFVNPTGTIVRLVCFGHRRVRHSDASRGGDDSWQV